MANDIFSTLRVYLSKLTEGEHTPAEVLASVNTWLRESGESIKAKIEEEVERAVAKRGFVKQSDFDQLKREVAALRGTSDSPKRSVTKKAVTKKTVTKKAPSTKPKATKKASPKATKK